MAVHVHLDGTVGETITKMSSRSTIFARHEDRQEFMLHDHKEKMEAKDTYTSGSVLDTFRRMTTQSSIYGRNARRLERNNA
mmetsp:Transcript_5616/g.12472  ORF Transcript_5616/g.12472 Transcript_5616/m.12472 type:complete len:81 (+) Transcript_5616:77-319(+)